MVLVGYYFGRYGCYIGRVHWLCFDGVCLLGGDLGFDLVLVDDCGCLHLGCVFMVVVWG